MRLVAMIAVAIGMIGTATAAVAAAPSPLLGTWSLDLDSMDVPPEARPKSVTIVFSELSPGQWETRFEIVGQDGSVRRMTSHERLDGHPVAIEGDQLEADSVALTNPQPGVLVMGLAKDGRPGLVRVYAVAVDGRSMSESAANVGDDGKPTIRSFRYRKIR